MSAGPDTPPDVPADGGSDPLLNRLIRQFTPGRFPRLGVAVSGGGDSLALLHLLNRWRLSGGPELAVVTVDHALRAASRREAEDVGAVAAGLGLSHAILTWEGWDRQGNLQDQARSARQRLIADWANEQGLDAVALGHTADDQAETVLLRLLRGSGVDGLAGMQAERQARGIVWLRPILDARRSELRDWLRGQGIAWVDDPSNEDPRFDRVRARQALAALENLGLGVPDLCATAERMGRAREALDQLACHSGRGLMRRDCGDVVFAAGLWRLPEETRGRLVTAALSSLSGAAYRPRYAALIRVLAEAEQGQAGTLGGCLFLPEAGGLRMAREYQAVAALSAAPGAPWDGRWILHPPSGEAAADVEIRALGEAGLQHCADWRLSGRPRAALRADPAAWSGETLVAAPLAGLAAGWFAQNVGEDVSDPLQQGGDDHDPMIFGHFGGLTGRLSVNATGEAD